MKTSLFKSGNAYAMFVIGILAANCVMADIAPWPTRKRPQPIPMKAEPVKKPEAPVYQEVEPSDAKKAGPMTATVYGQLIELGPNSTKDANYAVCRKVGDKLVPVSYIKTDLRLEKYEKHQVRVTGISRQIKGWTCPVLLVEYLSNIEFWPPESQPKVDVNSRPKADIDPLPKTETEPQQKTEVVIPKNDNATINN